MRDALRRQHITYVVCWLLQITPEVYHGTDIYNGCLLRLAKRVNNTGPPDAVLYDWPLGWTDPWWARCFEDKKKAIDDKQWRHISRSYLSLHTRYPKEMTQVPGSALQKALDTINAFFDKCTAPSCIPMEGGDLANFGMTNVPAPSPSVQSKSKDAAKQKDTAKSQATAKPKAAATSEAAAKSDKP